jgi:hypothetical protein
MSDVTLSPMPSVGKVTQLRVVGSEWTKLHSIRSTRWSMGVAAVATIALPLIFSLVTDSHWETMRPEDRATANPLTIGLAGVFLAQLAIAVLGVLVITGEYSTGMIRASMTAVPKRLPVLWAKIAVFGAATFALMLGPVLIGFFGSQAILDSHDHILQVSFTNASVFRTVICGAVYLMLVGIFALAIGAIVRNTAGGIATFAGIFFVIPPLMNIFPSSWNDAVSPRLPDATARTIIALHHGSRTLSPWAGGGLFVAYCAILVGIAAVLLVRRDT